MAELPRTSSRQRWTLALVCTAAFMLLLDITIVSVALPSIQRDLRASLPDLQWVSAAYALVLAVLLLPAATLGDRLGRRRLFLTGLVIFTVGSLACALAWTALALELFRALQGVGGAVLFATPAPRVRRGGAAAARPPARRGAWGRLGADRPPGLAVPLLRQPAHRGGGVRGRGGPAPRIPRPARRPGRLAGHGPDHRGADRADVRADPRQRAGLGQPGDRGPVRGRSRGLCRVRDIRAAHRRRAHGRPAPVRPAQLRRDRVRGVRDLGDGHRDDHLPVAVCAEHPRLLPGPGRAAVPAAVAGLLRGRPADRPPHRQGGDAGAAGRGHGRGRSRAGLDGPPDRHVHLAGAAARLHPGWDRL